MNFLLSQLILLLIQLFGCDSHIRDWLITDLNSYPEVVLTNCVYGESPNEFPCIELSNSLISRKFITTPNFFTVEYNSYLSSSSYIMGNGVDYILRSPFSPEAIIGFNNKNYSIGGVSYINNSNTTSAFWTPSWLQKDNIMINDTTWLFNNYKTSTTLNKLYEWTPGIRHSFDYINWPPKGLQLTVTFTPPKTAPIEIQNYIKIKIIYEMYQGMPILSKQIIIESSSPYLTSSIYLTYVQVEQLKTNIPYSLGENNYKYWTPDQGDNKWSFMNTQWGQYPGYLFLWNDYAHLTSILWYDDTDKINFKTNNYGGYEPMVISYFTINDQQTEFSIQLNPNLPGTKNGIFKSFRTFELIFDSYNWERQSLSMRRLMTYISPSITESPIYAQTMNMSNSSVYRIINQCAQSGFEMLTFSFDSDFNMFTQNKTELNYYKQLIQYANSKGIEIGGYNLEAMTLNYTQYNRVEIDGSKPSGACFASGWYDNLTSYVDTWVNIGGTMFITDGPYPGYSCASLEHKYHNNLYDSTFRQIYMQQEWYLYYRNQSIYIHSPDPYYFYGINRNKYQYDEFTTTLPRWWDMTIYRQLMYDESYIIPVTAGWMFLPMMSYHEGQEDAIFEPLHKHIDEYSFALGQYFSYSVAATIRGYELWDNENTKQVVIKWVNYYKKYRHILMSDIIHIIRPNNQNIDAILHVNHLLIDPCGLLIVFNPLNQTLIQQYIDLDLYYTGAKNTIYIAYQEERPFKQITLNNQYKYTLNFNISARNISYWVFNCNQQS
eukprot:464033_1